MTTMRLENDIPVALAPLGGLISISSKGSLPGDRMVVPREDDREMLDKIKVPKATRPRSNSSKPTRRKNTKARRRSSSLDIFQKLDLLKSGGDKKKMSSSTRSASRRLKDDARSSAQVLTEKSRKDKCTPREKDTSGKRLNKSCSALENRRTRTSKSHSPRRHTVNPKKQRNDHSRKGEKTLAGVSKAICSDSNVDELEFYDWANHTQGPPMPGKTMKSSKSNLDDKMSKSCNTLEGQRTNSRRETKHHVRRTVSSPVRESKDMNRSSKKTSSRSRLVKSSSNPDLGERLNKSHSTLVDQRKSVKQENKKPVRRTRSSPKIESIKEHARKSDGSYNAKSSSSSAPDFEFHIHPRSPPIEHSIQGSRNSLNKSCNSLGGQSTANRRKHSIMDQKLPSKSRESELIALRKGSDDTIRNQRSPINSPGSTPKTSCRARVGIGDKSEIPRLRSSSITRHRIRRLEEPHHQKVEARQSHRNRRDMQKHDSHNVTKDVPPLTPFSKSSTRQASEKEPKSNSDLRRSESLTSSIRRRSSRISIRRERPMRSKSVLGDDDDDDDKGVNLSGLSQSYHDNRHDRRRPARNPGRRQSLKRESMRQSRPLLADAALENDSSKEYESAMDSLTSMRQAYHDNRHGRRTVSHSPVRRQSYKGKAAQQIALQSLLDSDEDLEENLAIGAYDDEDEQETPVGYKSARMSVIGRKGPRLTADSLMGKLGMKVDSKLLHDHSEHTDATMDGSQSERSILGMGGFGNLIDELEEDLTIGAYDDEIFTTSTKFITSTDIGDTMESNNHRASATMRSSTIVLPHTQQVKIIPPPREGALPYTGAYSDLYNDEESFVNGI